MKAEHDRAVARMEAERAAKAEAMRLRNEQRAAEAQARRERRAEKRRRHEEAMRQLNSGG